MKTSLHNIASLIEGQVIGDGSTNIVSLAAIDNITADSLVYAEGADNLKLAENSPAAALLVNKQVENSSKPLIQTANPMKAFITLLHYFHPAPIIQAGIHPSAVIEGGVELGEEVFIGPYVVIETGSKIGDGCVLKSHIHIGRNVIIGEKVTIHAHVTVYDNTEIGNHSIIHASTVIGSDGFGYVFVDGQHLKVPHMGSVNIGKEVEIGANTAIDRATLGETKIGDGTKIDNLVQVAHSVKLGKHNILCGFTGIAGSTTTGDNVVFAANVGVSDHVRIDDGVILGARTGVPPNKHLRQGNIYLGNPARPKDIAIKHELAVNRIPAMRNSIKTLTDKIDLLTQRMEAEEVK